MSSGEGALESQKLMFREGVSPHFLQILMVKERSSGVKMPNYGEMKGRCLTLA